MSVPPPTLPERFSAYIFWLTQAVAKHTGWDRLMPPLLIGLIAGRLRTIRLTVLRLAARIGAGKYRRRPYAPRPDQKGRQPKTLLPREKNWLVPLMPEIVLYRGQLERMLHDPEMVALIEAAPEAMGPPLRSLCRLLGWPPPPILAKARARRPRPATARPISAPAAAAPTAPAPPPRVTVPARRPRAARPAGDRPPNPPPGPAIARKHPP